MSLIYSKEFDIEVTPREDIISFHCNPDEEADIYNEEGKCCCYCTEHTYYIAKKLDTNTKIKEISGYLLSGPREHDEFHTITLLLQVDGEFIEFVDIQVHTQNITLFTIALDEIKQDITGFKFVGTFIDKSYGKISYKDKYMSEYDNKTICEQEDGYWYGNACHLIEPRLEDLTMQEDCEAHGYYWANNACHKMPIVCEDWLTKQDCEDAGCNWWEDESKCYRDKVKKIEYTLPEPTKGKIRIPIGDNYYNKVLDIWYEMVVEKEGCPATSSGKITSQIHIGGSYVESDSIYWKCRQDKINTKSHDYRYNTGGTYKGPYVDIGSNNIDYIIKHFKCIMHVKECDDYYDE